MQTLSHLKTSDAAQFYPFLFVQEIRYKIIYKERSFILMLRNTYEGNKLWFLLQSHLTHTERYCLLLLYLLFDYNI